MLARSSSHTTLPAADLDRARGFYEGKLGFQPAEVRPGGVLYETAGGSRFLVFPSSGRPSGGHTQIGFRVDDMNAVVADLRSRGVVFESYDMPTFDPATMIATFPDLRSAWFKDTEGNLIGLVQFTS